MSGNLGCVFLQHSPVLTKGGFRLEHDLALTHSLLPHFISEIM